MMHHTLNEKFSYFFASVCVGLIGFLPVSGEAQTVIGGQTPDPSAMLDIQSTSKGVLFPRVTNNSSVPSPATSLIIWNDDTGCLEINLGTPGSPSWQTIKCEVRCGAYVASGVWKRFMCHNLGAANFAADPFTPSWEINGGYWQWGRQTQAASGPDGSDLADANSGAITMGWNSNPAPNGAWEDGSKTQYDPCPDGYRVPTITQWQGVIANNTVSNASGSTWTAGDNNYNSGKNFGSSLMLPAAGYRFNSDGELVTRGSFGYYWSSSENATNNAWNLGFNSGGAAVDRFRRANAFSVRCVAE